MENNGYYYFYNEKTIVVYSEQSKMFPDVNVVK